MLLPGRDYCCGDLARFAGIGGDPGLLVSWHNTPPEVLLRVGAPTRSIAAATYLARDDRGPERNPILLLL